MTHEVMMTRADSSVKRTICFMVVIELGSIRQWKMSAFKQHDRGVDCHSTDMEKPHETLRH